MPDFDLLYPNIKKGDITFSGGGSPKPAYLMTLEEYQKTVTPILQEYNKFIRKNEEFLVKSDYNGVFYYTFEEVMDDFKSGNVKGRHFRRDAYDKFLSDEQVVRKNWAYRKVNRFDENFVPSKTPSGLREKKNEYIDRLRNFFSDEELYSRIEKDEVKSNKRSVKRAIDNDTYKKLLEENKISVMELQKVFDSVGVKMPKKVFSESAIKVQERENLYWKIYNSLPYANRGILTKFINDVKEGFKPLEKIIYEREVKRFNESIEATLKEKEVEDVILVRRFIYDVPFWYKIFHAGSERKEQIKLPRDKYGREPMETHIYYSDFKLLSDYKEVIHNQVTSHIESLKVNLLSVFAEHFIKITKPMSGFEQLNLAIGAKGFEGTYKFNFEDGSNFVMNTEAIGAGGYNIQKYHFRYLVHFRTATLADGTILHDLSKIELLKHFSTAETLELENPYIAVQRSDSVEMIIDALINHLKEKVHGVSHVRKGSTENGSYITFNGRKRGMRMYENIFFKKTNSLDENKNIAYDFLEKKLYHKKPEGFISMGGGGITPILLAPNGKPSNLSKEHYELVRTFEFKDWFGDWEKKSRINKLLLSENIDLNKIKSYCEIPHSIRDNHNKLRKYFNSIFNNTVIINNNSSLEISIANKSVKKILNHNASNTYHVYLSFLNTMASESIFISSLPNNDEKSRNEILRYFYFMGGIIDLDDSEKTIYCAVEKTRKYGYKFYDLTVFKIKRSELIKWSGISNPRALINPDLYNKDKKLSLIFDTSFEKNLDENGEPKISEIFRFLSENSHIKLSIGGTINEKSELATRIPLSKRERLTDSDSHGKDNKFSFGGTTDDKIEIIDGKIYNADDVIAKELSSKEFRKNNLHWGFIKELNEAKIIASDSENNPKDYEYMRPRRFQYFFDIENGFEISIRHIKQARTRWTSGKDYDIEISDHAGYYKKDELSREELMKNLFDKKWTLAPRDFENQLLRYNESARYWFDEFLRSVQGIGSRYFPKTLDDVKSSIEYFRKSARSLNNSDYLNYRINEMIQYAIYKTYGNENKVSIGGVLENEESLRRPAKDSKSNRVSQALSDDKDIKILLDHLYKEHHEAFDSCGVICDAATKSPDEAARIIAGLWKSELEHHFREEEEIVFPKILSINSELEQEVGAIVKEHRRFERMIDELRIRPSSETAKAFCLLLQSHIVREEKLFNVIMPDPYKSGKDIIYIDLDDTLADEKSTIESGGDPNAEGFYARLKPIAGGIEAVRELSEHYDVRILSAPSTDHPYAWTEKVLWVKKYFGDLFENKITLSPDKSLIEGKYLIDNSLDNIGFKGEFIHFDSDEFPDWDSIVSHLIPSEVIMGKGGEINLKNTKVVDSKGKPLIVYHGSQNPNLTKFSGTAYFTDDIDTAKSFADRSFMGERLIAGEVPTLYYVHLNLENPKIITTEDEYEKYFQDVNPEEHEKIKREHDGMIYYPEEGGDNYYLVFDPSRIQIVKKEILSDKKETGGYVRKSDVDEIINHINEQKSKGESAAWGNQYFDFVHRADGQMFRYDLKAEKDAYKTYTDVNEFARAVVRFKNRGYDGGGIAVAKKKIKLIAPSGKPSNLNKEQYKLVRTDEFKNWFGDWENDPKNSSKVVDENGEPMVVYHSSNNQFSIFRTSSELGAHFGTKLQATDVGFREGKSGFMYMAFLNIRHPIRLVDDGEFRATTLSETLLKKGLIENILNEDLHSLEMNGEWKQATKEIQEASKAIGIDGVIYLNRREGVSHSEEEEYPEDYDSLSDEEKDLWFMKFHPEAKDSWIIFSPEQIKLSDGSNTTFDGSNPDIRYGKGGEINKLITSAKNYDPIDEDSIQEKMLLYPKKYKGHVLDNIPKNQSVIMVSSSLFEREKDAFVKTSKGTIAYHNRPIDEYWERKIDNGERPPVLVGVYDGQLRVRDGNHRLNTYLKKGFKEIPVILNIEAKKYLTNPDIRYGAGGSADFDNPEKSSKFVNIKPAKNETQNVLSGKSQVSNGAAIQSAPNFLRRNAGTGSEGKKPELYNDGGEADEPEFFWGREAAGVLVVAKNTGRILLLHRSEYVLEPLTWGIVSGKIDAGEDVAEAALRELAEEIKAFDIEIYPSYIFERHNFKFHNFIGIADEEFVPDLNWENTDYGWFDVNKLPSPLHFGVQELFKNIDIGSEINKIKSGRIRFYEGGKLLAPNGKPSKLNPVQYRLVRTDNFKNWFGDWESAYKVAGLDFKHPSWDGVSKVVGLNGEPIVANHYSDSPVIDVFKMKGSEGYSRKHSATNTGIYFNLGETIAKYGQYPHYVFLNFKNPLRVKFYRSEIINPATGKNIHIEHIIEDDIKFLKESGYDSVMSHEGQVVAISPYQIKSAEGENTTFNSNNPDIHYEMGGRIGQSIKYDDLPEDMQTLIFQYFEDSGIKNVPKKFPLVEISLDRFPKVPFTKGDRGEEYAKEMIGEKYLPPIIISGDVWIDGRHRVYAAKLRGDKTIKAIDLSAWSLDVGYNLGKLKSITMESGGYMPPDFAKSTFIHASEKKNRKSILENGLGASNNPVIVNGIYTFPEDWGHWGQETFGDKDWYYIKLKNGAKIFWTDADRPIYAEYGRGSREYKKVYAELIKKTGKTKKEILKLEGDEWFEWKSKFSRAMEDYLKEHGYDAIQKGGEVVIVNVDAIESILLNNKIPIKVSKEKYKLGDGCGCIHNADLFESGGDIEHRLIPVKILTPDSLKDYVEIEVSDYLSVDEVKNVVSGKYEDWIEFRYKGEGHRRIYNNTPRAIERLLAF